MRLTPFLAMEHCADPHWPHGPTQMIAPERIVARSPDVAKIADSEYRAAHLMRTGGLPAEPYSAWHSQMLGMPTVKPAFW